MKQRFQKVKSFLCSQWRNMIIVLTPLALLPLPLLVNSTEARAGYVLLLVSIYWVSSALPLAVSSLLPIALLPLLGVMGTNDVCSAYFKGPNFVCLCSVALALGVQQSNLHQRLALKALLLVGTDPKWLVLIFMAISSVMSMWIAATAVTAMLLPIMGSVINEIFQQDEMQRNRSIGSSMESVATASDYCSMSSTGTDDRVSTSSDNHQIIKIGPIGPQIDTTDYKKKAVTAMYISVAYSTSIGGTTTLVGSGVLLLKEIMDGLYPGHEVLSFPSYMALTIPMAIVTLTFIWLWMCFIYTGFRKKENFSKDTVVVRKALTRQYEEMGPITFHQGGIIFLFAVLILLWLLKAPKVIPGWASLMSNQVEIGDATPAMIIIFLAFVIPANPKLLFGGDENGNQQTSTSLLDWNYAHKNLQWDVLLLFGGGYALSEASQKSHLSDWIGNQLISLLDSLPPIAIMILVCFIISIVTEVSSNNATAAIFLPMLTKLAESTGKNPLYLMIPATIHCNYAFLLPAGTPPNFMVLAAGGIEPSHLLRNGLVINVFAMLVCCLLTATLGESIFHFSTLPQWMIPMVNETTLSSNSSYALY